MNRPNVMTEFVMKRLFFFWLQSLLVNRPMVLQSLLMQRAMVLKEFFVNRPKVVTEFVSAES